MLHWVLDSINIAKFLDQLSDCQVRKKEYSIELFSYIFIINNNFTAKLHLKNGNNVYSFVYTEMNFVLHCYVKVYLLAANLPAAKSPAPDKQLARSFVRLLVSYVVFRPVFANQLAG